jgi:hypothetical protein
MLASFPIDPKFHLSIQSNTWYVRKRVKKRGERRKGEKEKRKVKFISYLKEGISLILAFFFFFFILGGWGKSMMVYDFVGMHSDKICTYSFMFSFSSHLL